MKQLYITIFALFATFHLSAQHEPIQPYEDLGIKVKVLTLSNGKYQESFPNDTLHRIGSVLFNRVTGEVETVVIDTTLGEYSFRADVPSRWLSPDPLAAKFPEWSPYAGMANNPVFFIDKDGREPARNQAGTIQDAIAQWEAAGITDLQGIQDFVRNKNIDGNGTAAIRYVYTEERGWIDLSHYVLVQERGKIASNLLEPVGGTWIAQIFLGEDADRSTYSYEDLPSNQFSSEIDLTNIDEQEVLFNTIENHFVSVNATNPEDAPNYTKIPLDDHDRERIPNKLIYGYGSPAMDLVPRNELLKTGKYVPQNRSSTPMSLKYFDAAETSIETEEKKKKEAEEN